ncbi:hypothetical protein [Burkholderia cenocepacia]|uniref:hypothetical protein n=1 Tax=Burkholderia cenocepacia TaxID=95486 RepID=UPI00264EBDD5|nr:hypothetical protein [Burkholderia cenocepacia]MDN7542319.1 hypothetical protein [Burkholderia cenocepacia]
MNGKQASRLTAPGLACRWNGEASGYNPRTNSTAGGGMKAGKKAEDEKAKQEKAKVGLGARADNEWRKVRGMAWSRAVRAMVEKVLNRSDDLTPRMREPAFLAHLQGAMSRIAGDARFHRPGKAWEVSGRDMDHLAESFLDDVGSSSNTWSRWEKGANQPEGRRWIGAMMLFPADPSDPPKRNVDTDDTALKVVNRDLGFGELFWHTGPCWDDRASPVPLWAMMGGNTSIEGLWVPVLRYHDGTGLDGHAVADFLHGGVAFVRSQQPEQGASSGTARRSMFPKPGFTPAPGAAPSPYDGPARWTNLANGERPLLDPDLPLGGQTTLTTGNNTYQAQRLASLDADWFHRLIDAGTAAQDDDSAALGVGDVVVLTLATTFTAGEQGDLRHRLEDRVFAELRARHRRIVRWAHTFGIEGGVRRWLRRLYAEYLDRNRLAFPPVETPARPDEELEYDRDDPEAEYLALGDNVPTVTVEPARRGRLTWDDRLSRRGKA